MPFVRFYPERLMSFWGFTLTFVIPEAFVVLLSVSTRQEWSKEGVLVKH